MRRFNESYTSEVEEEKVPAREEPMESKTKNGRVLNSAYVNLRKSPSGLMSDIAFAVPRGTKVEILTQVPQGYYKIRYKEEVYYISKDFCKEE